MIAICPLRRIVRIQTDALRRQKRRQFLNDHLLANGAEGLMEISHATVELRTVNPAVIIVRAFEEPDCPHRNW